VRTKLGVDYNKLLDEVQSRIDGIQNLPPNAYRPQVFRWDAREDTFYFALHGNVDRLTLQRAATDLRFEVTKLPGLQLTKQMTKIDEQVTIEISEDALRQYNLTFSEVSNAIGGSSVNLSAGTVETAAGKLQLRARSLADNAEDFRNIIVRQTPDGGAIRIRDIAQVIDGFDTAKFSAKFNGENAAIFQVASPDNTNVSLAGKSIRKFEEEINAKLPPDLTFSIWFDGSEMFDSRMELIGSNAISGMILVLIILMLFLRPAVAIWVTAGIAAAFMGAIAIAPYIGITLNMISLFAFLLVIGIVVDDAIVVGESTHFHVENGISGNRGAIAGANMVVKPVFFAVVTTILMFIPFLLMTGPIQAMLGQISLVVIAVLIFSLIEAFFILPSHLRHLKPLDTNNSGKLMRLQAKIANSLVVFAKNIFRPVIAALIKFRYVTVSVFVGLFAMSIMLLQAGVAPTAFIPEVEGDMIEFNARFPEGTNFERREQVRKQVSAGVKELNRNSKKEFNVDTDIIERAGTVTENRGVQGFFSLSDPADRPEISSKDVADKLEQYVGEIPDAYRVKYGVDYGPGGQSGGGLYYAVASADPDALKAAILDLKAEIESFSAVSGAWDGLESSAREIRFTLKPGAETLGIKLTDVTRQVREAFYGKEVQRLPRNGEDVRVMVRYPEEARESIDSLQQLRIRSSKGVDVPLFSVANISFEEGITRIQRRDRKRVEYTGARIRGDQTEVQKISKDIKENFLPEWEIRHPKATRIEVGQDEIELNFIEEIKLSMIAILFMMYGLLAIAFKSYAQPLLA
jgi:multidrug efflux pump subunit AcrB